jgi:hypothetical protein
MSCNGTVNGFFYTELRRNALGVVLASSYFTNSFVCFLATSHISNAMKDVVFWDVTTRGPCKNKPYCKRCS